MRFVQRQTQPHADEPSQTSCSGSWAHSSALQLYLDDGLIDGRYCDFTAEQFACASVRRRTFSRHPPPSLQPLTVVPLLLQLSALTAAGLAAVIRCNSSASRPVWTLLLTDAEPVVDAALDILSKQVQHESGLLFFWSSDSSSSTALTCDVAGAGPQRPGGVADSGHHTRNQTGWRRPQQSFGHPAVVRHQASPVPSGGLPQLPVVSGQASCGVSVLPAHVSSTCHTSLSAPACFSGLTPSICPYLHS